MSALGQGFSTGGPRRYCSGHFDISTHFQITLEHREKYLK